MRTHEYWRELETGDVWAVELVEGEVVGRAGPFNRDDVDERYLEALDYSPERAAWTETHREAFDVFPLVGV